MNSIISSFSLGKDISYDVLSWNLHGTETMSRPLSEARAGALTWDPFRATNRLQITNNPPFVGHNVRSDTQKADMEYVFGDIKTDKIDYVACWFYKAADMMHGTKIHTAFVATNSICQGVSIGILWKQIFEKGCLIDFAWPTFIWDSEANDKANVHVVVVGFSPSALPRTPVLYRNSYSIICKNINGYLVDAPNICLDRRTAPISNVPKIRVGSNCMVGAGAVVIKKVPDGETVYGNPARRL